MLGDGSQTNPFIITQPSDFDVVRNNTTTETTVYYELGNDIDFNNVLTKSLNFDLTNAKFTSSIDGKGYTIKNLNFHNPTLNIGGFFGRITDTSTIKNIKFENMTTTVHNPSATVAYASLLAHFIQGTVENIHLHGAINFSGYYQSISAIGNRLIPANNTYVKNVYVDVDINIKNLQPRLATSTDLAINGFANALYASTTNANAVSDVVVNSRLNVVSSNLANAKINPVSYFAQNNVVYPRLYGNTTTFTPTITLDTINSLTDETIKQPLDLDTNAWIQKSGEIPQLRTFADLTNRFTVHATSSMRGIDSVSRLDNKKKTLQSNTRINPIVSDASKSKRIQSQVNTHVSPITSNSMYIDYLIRIYKVGSSISPINAKVDYSKRIDQFAISHVNTITTDSQSSKASVLKSSIAYVKPIDTTIAYNFKTVPIYRDIELDVSYQLHKSVISVLEWKSDISALEWKSILSADKRTRKDI